MVDIKKQEYYIKNREARLQYQRDYYDQNKDRVKKNRAKKMLNEPSLIGKEREYNKKYYEINKKKIMEQRYSKRRAVNRPL